MLLRQLDYTQLYPAIPGTYEVGAGRWKNSWLEQAMLSQLWWSVPIDFATIERNTKVVQAALEICDIGWANPDI